jgi:hypothetical protein
VSLYYIDTSAALKLLVDASHSRVFAAFYDESAGASWVSSALLRIEVTRAVSRVMPAVLPAAREMLLGFDYVRIDAEAQRQDASTHRPRLQPGRVTCSGSPGTRMSGSPGEAPGQPTPQVRLGLGEHGSFGLQLLSS